MTVKGIKAHFLFDCIAYKYQFFLLPGIFFVLVPILSTFTSVPVYFEYMIFLLILPRFMQDFQNNTAAYTGSLPISRNSVVFARYLWIFSMLIAGMIFLYITGTLCFAVRPDRFESWAFARSPWSLPYVFMVNTPPLLIALPLYYGIGPAAGLIGGYLGVLFYLPGMPLLIHFLEGLHSDLRGLLTAADSKTGIFGYAVFLLEKTAEKIGPGRLLLIIIVPFIVLFLVSLLLSAGFSRRKDLV